MKSINLITAAIVLSTLSSCSLLGSILQFPGSLMETVGRTAGLNALTNDAPEPTDETTITDEPNSQPEADQSGKE